MGRRLLVRNSRYRQFRNEVFISRALLCAWLLFYLCLLLGVVYFTATDIWPRWSVIAAPVLVVTAAVLMVQYRFLPVFARQEKERLGALRTLTGDQIGRLRRKRRTLLIASRILTLLWLAAIPVQSKMMFASNSELWAGLLILQLPAALFSFLIAWTNTIIVELFVWLPLILFFYFSIKLGHLLTAILLLPFKLASFLRHRKKRSRSGSEQERFL